MALTHSSGFLYRYEFVPRRRYTFLSAEVEEILGYPAEAFYADPDFDLAIVHPDDRHKIEMMERNPVQSVTVRCFARDGSVVTLDFENVLVVNEAKNVVVMQGVGRVVNGRGWTARVPKLSRREIDVLQLAAGDCTDEQIAKVLSISKRTVEHHLAHVRAKIGTSSTKAAVAAAMRQGLLDVAQL